MKFRCKRLSPNVCLLDCGKFYLDGEQIGRAREEVLRADRIARTKCGYKFRTMTGIQPWCRPKEKLRHVFVAEYEVYAEKEFEGIFLALEHRKLCMIELNGQKIKNNSRGWFTDRAIQKVCLPAFKKGKNVLKISEPFGNNTNPEPCYLLGNFGTNADETETRLFAPQKIEFGSLDKQGLKFYSQNVDYITEVVLDTKTRLKVCVPHFEGALIGVYIDGKEVGNIVYAPYEFLSETLTVGKHELKLRLYGDNYNTFSPLHVRGEIVWTGDYSWYAEDENWTYAYLTKPFGILSEPKMEIIKGRDRN